MMELREEQNFNDALEIVNDLIKNPIEGEDSRIRAINFLYTTSRMSAWGIGKICAYQEARIKELRDKWIPQKKGDEYPGAKSLHDWFTRKGGELKISYRTAKDCIKIFETTDQRIADKLGRRKLEIIRTAPEQYQEDLQLKAIDQNFTITRIAEEVDRVKDKVKKVAEFEQKIKPVLPKLKEVTIEDDKTLRIKLNSKGARDAFNDYVTREWPRISVRLHDLMKK